HGMECCLSIGWHSGGLGLQLLWATLGTKCAARSDLDQVDSRHFTRVCTLVRWHRFRLGLAGELLLSAASPDPRQSARFAGRSIRGGLSGILAHSCLACRWN